MLKGFTVPKSPFGQAALQLRHHPGTMPATLSESSSGRTLTRRQRHCRMVFPPDPKSNGHAVMMFLDWQFIRPRTTNILSRLVINIARRLFWSTQCIAAYRSCGVRTFMSTMTLRWRAVGRRGFQRKWAAFFRRVSFAASGPAAAPVAFRQSVWRQPLGAWPTSCGSLRHLAQAVENGMSLLSRPTVLLRYFPRLVGRLPGQACGQRIGDVDHRQSHPLPAHGSARASLIFLKRMVKNSTLLRRTGSSQGSVTQFLTQLAI